MKHYLEENLTLNPIYVKCSIRVRSWGCCRESKINMKE